MKTPPEVRETRIAMWEFSGGWRVTSPRIRLVASNTPVKLVGVNRWEHFMFSCCDQGSLVNTPDEK